jgi:hypothetical protein
MNVRFVFYMFDLNSNDMHMDFFNVFFITLYLLYTFRVLFASLIRSTNCRVQP